MFHANLRALSTPTWFCHIRLAFHIFLMEGTLNVNGCVTLVMEKRKYVLH